MKLIARILAWLVALIVVVTFGAVGWLYLNPPEEFRVANAYSAKIICSSVFVSGRKAEEVLADDVQAPGHWLLKYVSIARGEDVVTAKLFGFLAAESAVYRPGLGCASAPNGDLDAVRAVALTSPPVIPPVSDFEWPLGDTVSRKADLRAEALLADPKLIGPGARALVVVKDGRIVAEAYAPGFNAETPLLGWSMTKTVTGALAALRIQDGAFSWDKAKLFSEWTDDRAGITIAALMAMTSGLSLNESYGDVDDVTRMLFLEPDQAKFVRDKPLEAKPGEKFEYTTGTAVLLARAVQDTLADRDAGLAYPRQALFSRIGMRSAIFETDETGTFSGGSLLYATGRDWARFGLLLANGGDWNGDQILPVDYIERVGRASAVSGGLYTEALAWKSGTGEQTAEQTGLPPDAFWALGHDGQSIAMIPSANLVVVRLGLTPSKLNYDPAPLVKALLGATMEPLPEPEPEPAQP
ncbi:CubicO group peptidase (beta-lactamase class C family) [Rhizobium sp. SG_E_25_P2]|uniref:serine hydrolase domain-containing protein n=1 Tax=Rhizobium sp. SG_E_25_P2 TaxID=2879942 RepID=UPI002472F039|nr:serine hydrolase [Rhizobium sp. SG_E_25_P2]MDH6269212.1 CubicO group peptidase (beta-lactamase class C family) [Rhizobium sp. SG_E_25_P2]